MLGGGGGGDGFDAVVVVVFSFRDAGVSRLAVVTIVEKGYDVVLLAGISLRQATQSQAVAARREVRICRGIIIPPLLLLLPPPLSCYSELKDTGFCSDFN